MIIHPTFNGPAVSKRSPPRQVKQNVNCRCTCGHNLVSQPGTSNNHLYMKKQTCFHCGTPGYIAKNYLNRAYTPYYTQGRQDVARGRSVKRNSSRSRSSDGNWNTNNDRKQVIKENKDKTILKKNSRDNLMKPNLIKSRSVSPKLSHGSPYRYRWIPKRSNIKDKKISKSNVKASIYVSNKFIKSNYIWVPNGNADQSSHHPLNSSSTIFDSKDMVWKEVKYLDGHSQPSVSMD